MTAVSSGRDVVAQVAIFLDVLLAKDALVDVIRPLDRQLTQIPLTAGSETTTQLNAWMKTLVKHL